MKFIKNKFLLIALVLLLSAGAYSCQKEQGNIHEESNKSTGLTGTPEELSTSELLASMNILRFKETKSAPDFELLSLQGTTNKLSQYKGNVVLLSFWSTW